MKLDDIAQSFWKHWKRWNEFYLIPLALILWQVHLWILPLFDPTAAPPDAGIFSYAVAMLVVILIAKGTNWLLLRFTWPGIYSYLDLKLEEDLWSLSNPYHRVLFAFLFWAVSLFAIILVYKTGF